MLVFTDHDDDPSTPAPLARGERILYDWPLVQVGTFDCWPDDDRWRRPNCVEEGHVIAFPGRSVIIAQDGDRPRVTDPHRLVFYNRYQAYHRGLISRDGDHCSYLVVALDLLHELQRADLAPPTDVERHPFPVAVAAVAPRDYLEMQAIVRCLGSDSGSELEVQERLVRLIARIVQSLRDPATRPRARAARGARRDATRRAREELVEQARSVIGRELDRPLSLQDVAAEVGVSVYHLSRVFREHTGLGVHAYRDQLRLLRGLPWLLDGSVRLTDLALASGYASPSHYTDRFRALYGVAPSRLRAQVAAGQTF